MADLANMYVTADVYEGDILKIEPGMKASAKSASLPRALDRRGVPRRASDQYRQQACQGFDTAG